MKGGARPGAGRKALDKSQYVRQSYYIDRDLLNRMPSKDRSLWINEIIRKELNK